jgi:hypothetical protein
LRGQKIALRGDFLPRNQRHPCRRLAANFLEKKCQEPFYQIKIYPEIWCLAPLREYTASGIFYRKVEKVEKVKEVIRCQAPFFSIKKYPEI